MHRSTTRGWHCYFAISVTSFHPEFKSDVYEYTCNDNNNNNNNNQKPGSKDRLRRAWGSGRGIRKVGNNIV